METCPHCGRDLVLPYGRPKSPVLLVGEFPGVTELRRRQPWVGDAGTVLRTELMMQGVQMEACRMTNLWLHEKPKGGKKDIVELNKRCFDWCFGMLLEQIVTARAIFMMGSELAPLFVGLPVSKINGARVTSQYVSPETVIVASYNPAICLNPNGVVGDFRFAVGQFASYAKQALKEARDVR